MCRWAVAAFLVSSVPLGIVAAEAASNKDQKRERQALRRVQQQLNEIQQQKVAVDQEKTELEEALGKAHDEAESRKRSAASAAAKASRLEKEIDAANTEAADLRSRLHEAVKQNEELSAQRKQLEQDIRDTAAEGAKQSDQRKLCETNNDELYRIGLELVDWYATKGAFNAILEAEPFTGMRRVEMENLLENYREKLEGQHPGNMIN